MNRYFSKYIIFIGLLAIACTGKPGAESGEDEQQDEQTTYSLEVNRYQVADSVCVDNKCTDVIIEVPVLKGGAQSERINQSVDMELREVIKSRLPEPTYMGSWLELAELFIEGHHLYRLEFPGDKTPWFLKIIADRSVLSDLYFTSFITASDFMGGAHPNTFAILRVYSLTTGDVVNVRDVVDAEALAMKAEKMYRNIHQLKANDPLDDGGFFFPGGQFILPENMGLTDEGVLLVYNPYEVASYAKGMTVMTIRYEDLNAQFE